MYVHEFSYQAESELWRRTPARLQSVDRRPPIWTGSSTTTSTRFHPPISSWTFTVRLLQPVGSGDDDIRSASAVIEPAVLLAPGDTHIVPALIADLRDAANWRYVEF